MAAHSEVVLRQRVCRASGCNQVFWICRDCDRGQHYCTHLCRQHTRRQQHRLANRRYQQSPEGRQDHRDRQREYRRRHQRARVTDVSCKSEQDRAAAMALAQNLPALTYMGGAAMNCTERLKKITDRLVETLESP